MTSANHAAAPPPRSLGFRAWQLIIAVILSVTPLSYVYVATLCFYLRSNNIALLLHAYQSWSRPSLIAFSLLTAWMLAETLWLPYHLITANRLRARRDPAHLAKSPEDRKRLYERCLAALSDSDAVKTAIEGWFFGAPIESIRKANLVQWFSWALWDAEPSELSESEIAEVAQFVEDTERAGNVRFEDGFNANIECMRLTIDDMQMTHRPFVYYVAISAMHALAAVFLHSQGFASASVRDSDGGPQRYFYRRGNPALGPKKTDGPAALPIVFIHGIGIGFLHYAPLIARLPKHVDVFLIDWPHVSMRLAETVPSIPSTVASMTAILRRYNHDQACFVGHSLGSAAISWMLHSAPHLVASTVFLDPVVFLLVDPSVAYNFVYRAPTTVLELLMQYFVARELYIAHSLARHFNWSQNILFKEELPAPTAVGHCKRACVVLSAHDQVVPSAPVRRYLEGDPRVDLAWFETMTHGQMMFDRRCMELVQQKIEAACAPACCDT